MKQLQPYSNPEIEVIDMREKYDLMIGGDPNASTQDQFARTANPYAGTDDPDGTRPVWDDEEE